MNTYQFLISGSPLFGLATGCLHLESEVATDFLSSSVFVACATNLETAYNAMSVHEHRLSTHRCVKVGSDVQILHQTRNGVCPVNRRSYLRIFPSRPQSGTSWGQRCGSLNSWDGGAEVLTVGIYAYNTLSDVWDAKPAWNGIHQHTVK